MKAGLIGPDHSDWNGLLQAVASTDFFPPSPGLCHVLSPP